MKKLLLGLSIFASGLVLFYTCYGKWSVFKVISTSTTPLSLGEIAIVQENDLSLITTISKDEDICGENAENFTPYYDKVFQLVRKFVPDPSKFDNNRSLSCWHSNMSMLPLLQNWKSHNVLYSDRKWDFEFDDEKEAARLYNSILGAPSNKLVCLPNVFFGGFSKCGSTQLYNLLVTHPMITTQLMKEPQWWERRINQSLGRGHPYEELSVLGYISYFKRLSDCSEKDPSCIGIDASTTFFSWSDIHYGPCELPHLIHNVIPNAKFIVIMRDPTARLYSEYWFAITKDIRRDTITGAIPFHHCVVEQIEKFNNCLKQYNILVCVRKQHYYHIHSCYSNNHKLKITTGIYYIHIKKWLSVFPKEKFFFVRLEDFHDKPYETVSEIWKFLDLDIDSYKSASFLKVSKEALHQEYPPMLPETKEILRNFYHTYNEKLSKLLGSERYTWHIDTSNSTLLT